MSQYLLSTYASEGAVQKPLTPEQMQQFMERIVPLEAEMKETGTFVFTGRLHDPGSSTVVRPSDGDQVMTDGPFAEAKEQIAGFYIIEAEDLDAALAWAKKVVVAINHPIEVRPFLEMPGA